MGNAYICITRFTCNMNSLILKNTDDQIVLVIDKKKYDKKYLISLVKRLQLEEMMKQSKITKDVLNVAEEINEDWWNKHGDEFLKGLNR